MKGEQTRIYELFLTQIYKDIWKVIGILFTIIIIPFVLASIFTPDLIIKEGKIIVSIFWFLGIVSITALIMLIYGLIGWWVDCRWEKAKRKVKNDRY